MRVDVIGPDDWKAWRELRLEGLQDTPIGFMETYSDALRVTPHEWQERLGRPGVRLLAYDGDRAVGMAGGFRDEAGEPILFAVYVTPDARGVRSSPVSSTGSPSGPRPTPSCSRCTRTTSARGAPISSWGSWRTAGDATAGLRTAATWSG